MRAQVLVLSGTFKEKADGVARTLFRFSESLTRSGIAHHLFAPSGMIDPAPLDGGKTLATTHAVPSLPVPFYRDYRISLPTTQLDAQFQATGANVVHIATPDALGCYGLAYARRRGLPVVGVYHTHFPSYLSYFGMGFLQPALWEYLRWFYRHCDLFYAPTQGMADILKAEGVVGKRGIQIWGRGIDRTIFHPSRRDVGLRQQWGAGTEPICVAFVGRLIWYKGLKEYVGVYKRLQASGRYRFVVIGHGPILAELQAAMPEAVFTGYQPPLELGRILASCDLLCFPSVTETFGQVVQEALASGIPAVVSDVAGPPEIVRLSQGGLVVGGGDIEGFAAAVKRLSEDKAFYQACRTHGLAYAERLDWHAVNAPVIAGYAKLLEPF